MFNYTILFGRDPKYYEDFHTSEHEFKSASDALRDALSWVNEDSLQDCARIFVYNGNDDLIFSLNVSGYSLPVLRKKFVL